MSVDSPATELPNRNPRPTLHWYLCILLYWLGLTMLQALAAEAFVIPLVLGLEFLLPPDSRNAGSFIPAPPGWERMVYGVGLALLSAPLFGAFWVWFLIRPGKQALRAGRCGFCAKKLNQSRPDQCPRCNAVQAGYCPNCRYNLTGLETNRCPECGTEIGPTRRPAGVWYFRIACLWAMLAVLTAILTRLIIQWPVRYLLATFSPE